MFILFAIKDRSKVYFSFTINRLDYNLVFGFSGLGLDKGDRLNYGESLMTHAMLITGLNMVSSNFIQFTHATSCRRYNVFDPSVSPVFLVSATPLKPLNRIS